MLVGYIQVFTTTEKKEDAERIAKVLVEKTTTYDIETLEHVSCGV